MSQATLHTTRAPISRRANLSILNWALSVLDVWRSRHHLTTLELHMLEDIGITAKAAKTEANRPIWDVPAHWTK